MKQILVVEDEVLIRQELITLLEKDGYSATGITDFKNLSEQILNINPDLLLLDINLPEDSGFRVCQEIKAKTLIPLIILTSREQLKDEIAAINLGADDYLTKPFRKERLLVRIANVLKRYEGFHKNLLKKDGLILDKNTYTLYLNGTSIILPQNQGKLLEIFLSCTDKIISKEDLSEKLWQTTEYIDENAIQVNITRLKKIMKTTGMNYQIKTVRNQGYQLVKGVSDEK